MIRSKFNSPHFKNLMLTAGLAMAWESSALAATIYSCNDDGKRCVVKQLDGSIGNLVTVMDSKARVVAKGKVLRKKGTYAVISLDEIFKEIRKGYPVMVDLENEGSDFQWTASYPDNVK